MEVRNKTKGTVVASGAGHAKSFFSRLRGLLFTRTPRPLVIEAPSQSVEGTSIHMLFMLYPIDVVWADEEGLVVGTRERARPFSPKIFKPELPAKYVIELPVGTIMESGTEKGDRLSLL